MSAIGSSMTASRASSASAGRTLRRLRQTLRAPRDEQGASIIEMAFVSIFFFLFIAGIVDLGGAYQHYIITINAFHKYMPDAAPRPIYDFDDYVLTIMVQT